MILSRSGILDKSFRYYNRCGENLDGFGILKDLLRVRVSFWRVDERVRELRKVCDYLKSLEEWKS